MSVKVLVGDCRAMLATLPDKSVHMCVTSPPYWGLRAYGTNAQVWGGDPEHAHGWGESRSRATGNAPSAKSTLTTNNGRGPQPGDKYQYEQAAVASTGSTCSCGAWRGELGSEPTPGLFLEHMVVVFAEVWRVLRDDGTVWLNIGDSYAGSHGNGYQQTMDRVNRTTGSIGNFDLGRRMGRSDGPGMKPKDLMGIPWRLAFALQDAGWYLRSDIIWSKPNPMPESVTDRPTKSHEYLFLLTKSGTSQFWVHRDGLPGSRTLPAPDYRWQDAANNNAETAIEPPNWKTEKHNGGLRWRRVNLWSGRDYYYDADAIREDATYAGKIVTLGEKSLSKGQANGAGIEASGNGKATSVVVASGRNKRSVWTIATEAFPESHFATYPTALVEPCIKAGTSERGVCPECGAPWVRVVERSGGTTGKSWHDHIDDAGHGQRDQGRAAELAWRNGTYRRESTGWWPSCKHEVEPVPATVLDPFFGAGTTGLVADRLDRNCIGVELNPEYAEMARRRLTGDAPMFAEVAVS